MGNLTLISKGSFDIYLLKYDSKGTLLWAKQSGGTDYDEAYGVAFDPEGNVFLTGYFSGSANLSGVQVKSKGDRDFFITKYTKTGSVAWAKQGDGTVGDYATAVATDLNGNVFITGLFKGTLSFGGTDYVAKGGKDIFLAKYSSSGDFKWVRTGGGNKLDESIAIMTDKNGNCYVTGDFEGTAEFNKKIALSVGSKDVFLVKYDSDGDIEWLKRGGSVNGNAHTSGIDIDDSANVYIAGYFSGTAHFGKAELTNSGSDAVFLVKYNSEGDAKWAIQTAGKGNEHASAIKIDSKKNIYVAGEYDLDFAFGEANIKNIGNWDIFILKYNTSGEMLDVTQIGGTGYDKAYDIGLDGQSNVYITGYFSKAIIIGNTHLTSTDPDDSFLAKLKGF